MVADKAIAMAEHKSKTPGIEEDSGKAGINVIHSMSTLMVSRERQMPASSIVKPTCIPKTRNAARRTHTVLIGLTMSLPFSAGSAAKARNPMRSGLTNAMTISSRPIAATFPRTISVPNRRHSGSREASLQPRHLLREKKFPVQRVPLLLFNQIGCRARRGPCRESGRQSRINGVRVRLPEFAV